MINSFVFENFKNTIKEYSTKTGKLHSFVYEKVVYSGTPPYDHPHSMKMEIYAKLKFA